MYVYMLIGLMILVIIIMQTFFYFQSHVQYDSSNKYKSYSVRT